MVIRKRRNFIDFIKDDGGNWLANIPDIAATLLTKFTAIYSREPVACPTDLDGIMHPCISEAQNRKLSAIPSDEGNCCHPL
ncbi:hypothetical protein PanWU01x14_362270 [Parasponia andersonii]|uniref:Uncharacterized protein n=1 Tax=Parasponia andersonii TaxID=3476 RepID=A0A2P5A733_PARAD|nr:hypothetical protein PanWU01x14_362270 [Parasponia andersonii]